MKTTAIIYARLSKKTKDDISPQRQIEMCSQVAKKHNWQIEVFEELEGSRTGRSEKTRPVWRKVKEQLTARDDIAALIVADIARASRSKTDFFKLLDELRARSVELVSLKENFDTTTASGRAMLSLIAVLNEWFSEEISERQRVYYQHLKSAGVFYTNKPPQGLKIVGRGTARRLIASDETYTVGSRTRTYLDTIRAWLKLLVNSKPIGTYNGAVTLNERGYRWRGNDKQPRPLTFGDPRKVNETVRDTRVYDGILDAKLLNQARAVLQQRARRQMNGRRPNLPPPLLWGLLYCADCDRRYTIHHPPTKRRTCHYRHQHGDCPSEVNITAKKVDDQIWEVLERILTLPPERKRQIAERAAPAPKKEDTREPLQERLTRLEESWIEGIVSKETYLKKRQTLLDKIAAIPATPPHRPLTVEERLAALDHLTDLFRGLAQRDPWAANRSMRVLFRRIRVRRGEVVDFEVGDTLAPFFCC